MRKRDFYTDMKKLVKTFVSNIRLLGSRNELKMWGIDPKNPFGRPRDEYLDSILDIIGYYNVEPCDKCGHAEKAPKKDKQALAYATKLHENLGGYLENALLGNPDYNEDYYEDDEEDEDNCLMCGDDLNSCDCYREE